MRVSVRVHLGVRTKCFFPPLFFPRFLCTSVFVSALLFPLVPFAIFLFPFSGLPAPRRRHPRALRLDRCFFDGCTNSRHRSFVTSCMRLLLASRRRAERCAPRHSSIPWPRSSTEAGERANGGTRPARPGAEAAYATPRINCFCPAVFVRGDDCVKESRAKRC